jgi:glycyl-tRNA synthetase beta subunit
VKQLSAWVSRADWQSILPGYARCVRILRSQTEDRGPLTIDEGLLVDAEEKALFKALQTTVHGQPSMVDEFLEIIVKLVPFINAFFDKVLVMAEDKKVRENRLGLLQRISSLSTGIADFRKTEDEGQRTEIESLGLFYRL